MPKASPARSESIRATLKAKSAIANLQPGQSILVREEQLPAIERAIALSSYNFGVCFGRFDRVGNFYSVTRLPGLRPKPLIEEIE